MFDNIRKAFAVRFEPDGDGYLFRPRLTAPAVRVTAAERDRFLADYMKAFRIYMWSSVIAGPLFVIAVITGFIFQDLDLPTPALMALVAVMMAPMFLVSRWIYRAPDRALAGRVTSAPGYSEEAARKITMRRLTWRNIGFGFVILVVMLTDLLMRTVGKGQDLLQGDDRYMLIFPAVLAVFIAVQAFRKWRSERG
jgi:hypothetical protein